jgi:hypothetical protein
MVPDGITIRIEIQMRHVLCKFNKSQHGLLLSVYFGTTDVVSSLYTRITPTMMITHVCLSYTKITLTMTKRVIISKTEFEVKDLVKPK